jgi:hypothetical protein
MVLGASFSLVVIAITGMTGSKKRKSLMPKHSVLTAIIPKKSMWTLAVLTNPFALAVILVSFCGSAKIAKARRTVTDNRMAIDAIRKQIQRIAFDANVFDRGIGDYPYAQKCSEKRKKLLAEIEKLERPKQMDLFEKSRP